MTRRSILPLALLALSPQPVRADGSVPGAPPAPVVGPPAPTLIAADEHGIREVGLDGKVLRRITRRAAQHPRRTPDGRRVLYLTPDHAELRAVAIDMGADARVAKLPRRVRVCPTRDDAEGHDVEVKDLDVQADYDFTVDAGGAGACLSLKDRNVNMVNVDLGVYVDLATGKVSHLVTWPSECAGKRKLPECREAKATAPATSAPAFPYAVEKGVLVRHEGGKRTRIVKIATGDFEEQRPSPSGRWVVLLGNRDEGDYIHFDALLLDRQEGKVFPITAGPARALSHARLASTERGALGTFGVVGETTRRWMSGRDVLLVDSLLIEPGVKGIAIKGELAPVD